MRKTGQCSSQKKGILELKLKGGLGNQLYQIIAAEILSAKFALEIHLDLSFFRHQKLSYGDKRDITTICLLKGYKTVDAPRTYLLLEKVVSRISPRILGSARRVFDRRCKYVTDSNYEAVVSQRSINTSTLVVDGYFLNIHEFHSSQEGAAAIKSIKDALINGDNTEGEACASDKEFDSIACIHHRMGDYVRLRPEMIFSHQELREIVGYLESRTEISQIRIHTESPDLFHRRYPIIKHNPRVKVVHTPTAEKALSEFVKCKIFAGNRYSSMSTLAYMLRGENPRRTSEDITVIMPVYSKNISTVHLHDALRSIANQTVLPKQLIIVVNGISPCESEAYTREVSGYIENEIKPLFSYRVLALPEPSVSMALNRAISESTTQWLMRMDDDDLMCKERIEETDAAIKRLRSGQELTTPFIYSPAIIRNPDGSEKIGYNLFGGRMLELCLRLGLHPICHPTTTLNKKVIGKYPNLRHIEDYALWWRLLREKRLKPIYISKPLLIYRHSRGIQKESGNSVSLIKCNKYRRRLLIKNFEVLLLPRIFIDGLRLAITEIKR